MRPDGATSEASHERGFTLVELLVVMIIIAILMAIAVPTFLSQKSSAMRTQATSNIMLIKQAIETCSVGNTDGSYMGCSEHDPVWRAERSLAKLPRCCPDGPKVGGYDVNGVVGVNTRRYTPDAGEPVHGFEIVTWVQDGDKPIWFQLVHYPSGQITRKCGQGLVSPPLNQQEHDGPVAGSKACPTGRW